MNLIYEENLKPFWLLGALVSVKVESDTIDIDGEECVRTRVSFQLPCATWSSPPGVWTHTYVEDHEEDMTSRCMCEYIARFVDPKSPNCPWLTSFSDEYAWLSNFFPCNVRTSDGIVYKSAEAAFQAQKSLDMDERKTFATMTPVQAKRAGKRVKLDQKYWNNTRDVAMYNCCLAKFTQNPTLRQKLIDTNGTYLIEGNDWHDKYWGMVVKPRLNKRYKHATPHELIGENKLGKILMQIRQQLTNDEI